MFVRHRRNATPDRPFRRSRASRPNATATPPAFSEFFLIDQAMAGAAR